MRYETYFPQEQLRPFVQAIIISEQIAAGTYSVLPDTAIVMGFQYCGSLSYTDDGAVVPLTAAGITGLSDTHRVFSNSANTGSVLVLCSATGASAFFSQPMHELFGGSFSLDNLILRSHMDVVTERLNKAKSDLARVSVVEQFLIDRLRSKGTDELVTHAVQQISLQGGNIKIANLATTLHISQSQLEKRFRKMVGASPKKYASIVRIRHIINSHPKGNLTQLGLEAGYFDQAHFIKDFKSFTGHTPEQFFFGTE